MSWLEIASLIGVGLVLLVVVVFGLIWQGMQAADRDEHF